VDDKVSQANDKTLGIWEADFEPRVHRLSLSISIDVQEFEAGCKCLSSWYYHKTTANSLEDYLRIGVHFFSIIARAFNALY
jgi:hypothetical protein